MRRSFPADSTHEMLQEDCKEQGLRGKKKTLQAPEESIYLRNCASMYVYTYRVHIVSAAGPASGWRAGRG